jgi:CheY-like chemotaxis protein
MVAKKLTVLLIDDDIEDWEIFSLAMTEISPSIVCVHKGYCEPAIEAVSNKTITPDYIFLDLNMPRMPGRECLFHLKQIEHVQHIPVIIYSTSNRALERKELLEAGATFYICKTNTFAELVDQLKLVIQNYSSLP